MTKDSEKQNCVVPREVIEAALLLIAFVIAEWIWPVGDLLEGE